MGKKNIFTEDIEVPDIVQNKVEDALVRIQTEGTESMSNKKVQNMFDKKKSMFRHKAAAAACVCLLAAGSITAAAAAHHFWSRGMNGNIQATDEQQKSLAEQGVIKFLNEPGSGDSMAVTDGGITITPLESIVDGHFAYLSFSVEGYDYKEGTEPSFENTWQHLGTDAKDKNNTLNMCASFYDGIHPDENGAPVYDDGTPVRFDKDGKVVTHYETENGTLEYVMTLYPADRNMSLAGKTVHVGFENFGTVSKASYTHEITGNWEFDLPLPGQNAATTHTVGKALGNTGFTLDSVELSPISIRADYSVSGEILTREDDNGVPLLCGVILKDGTTLPCLQGGGMTGYTDETGRNAYALQPYHRVIDTNQVQSLVFQIPETGVKYTIDLA